MILGVDQGATISVDGGKSWSSWFNQATGQFYHVITDEQFPYVAYAAQQDSGTAAVPNRSDFGEITYREWYSIGGFEFCFIAPDPLNPNIVYSGGWYGSVVRFDKTTGQIAHVFVRTDKYRTAQMAPITFLAARSALALFRDAVRDENHQWRRELADHKSRSLEACGRCACRKPRESWRPYAGSGFRRRYGDSTRMMMRRTKR